MWQTVALGFAFGGQSQLLSNPMLGNGPYGGLPKPVQITKAQTTPMMIQKTVRLFVTSLLPPPLSLLIHNFSVLYACCTPI